MHVSSRLDGHPLTGSSHQALLCSRSASSSWSKPSSSSNSSSLSSATWPATRAVPPSSRARRAAITPPSRESAWKSSFIVSSPLGRSGELQPRSASRRSERFNLNSFWNLLKGTPFSAKFVMVSVERRAGHRRRDARSKSRVSLLGSVSVGMMHSCSEWGPYLILI